MVKSAVFDGNELLNLASSSVFAEAGYKELSSLSLQRCHISHLGIKVFSELARLVSLDLSHNKLTKCTSDQWKGLLNVKILDLSYNQITKIEKDAFEEMKHLEKLILAKNYLVTLSYDPPDGLRRLDLTGNRLSCDCQLSELMDRAGLEVVGECAGPRRLEGRSFSALRLSEFYCRPAVWQMWWQRKGDDRGRAGRLVLQPGQRVKLDCYTKGNPKPRVLWHHHGTVIGQEEDGNLDVSERNHPGGLGSAVNVISSLSIRNASLDYSGTWTCAASNVEGHSEQELTVFLAGSEHEGISSTSASPLYVWIVTACCAVLLLVVVGIIICCCRCRTAKAKLSTSSFMFLNSSEERVEAEETEDIYEEIRKSSLPGTLCKNNNQVSSYIHSAHVHTLQILFFIIETILG